MDPLLKRVPQIKPVDIGLFAGVLDYSKLSFIMGMIMKSNTEKRGIPEGDHRDWVVMLRVDVTG